MAKKKTRAELIKAFYKKSKGKDTAEFSIDQIVEFDFPKTKQRYFLVYDSFTASIEEAYFWVHNNFIYDQGMPEIEKISDIFAATEHSTFFGVSQQRIGLQQDKVSQFMGAIGKMIKDMFQIIRELRVLDERIEIYYKSKKMKVLKKGEYVNAFKYKNKEWNEERTPETENDHEITVKGLYVDMAEGGAKNPSICSRDD